MITGYPSLFAIILASPTSETASLPERIGTLARWASNLACTLSPKFIKTSGRGPMNAIPALITALAKSAFSERNP